MRNYLKEITKKASKKATASIKGYKVIDLQNGDRVLGTVVVEGSTPNVYKIKTPLGLKDLDLSNYSHAIDDDMKIVELNEKYSN